MVVLTSWDRGLSARCIAHYRVVVLPSPDPRLENHEEMENEKC
jgi:hypothetical protein